MHRLLVRERDGSVLGVLGQAELVASVAAHSHIVALQIDQARTVDELKAFVRGGVSFSNAPGVAFEYSNFAYALLGQIISIVAQEPYQRYITREILEPLGMRATRWEFKDIPAAKLALGISEGYVKADGKIIYECKDLRVGLFPATEAA